MEVLDNGIIFGFNFVNTRVNNILVSFEMYVQLVLLKFVYSFVFMQINRDCEWVGDEIDSYKS